MLLTKEQAAARLNSPDNLARQLERGSDGRFIKVPAHLESGHTQQRLEVIRLNRGGHANAGKTHVEYTNAERALIATVAKATGKSKETARSFGVSDDAVWNWTAGRTGRRAQTDTIEHPELKAAIEDRLGVVRDKALDKLMQTLGLIDENKVKDCTPIQQSTIASNLSNVVSRTSDQGTKISNSNVVVYAPQQRKINDFDIQDT